MEHTLEKKDELLKKLLGSAEKIGKIAEEEAPVEELNGSVSADFIKVFKEERFHRLLLPKKYSGPQIDLKMYTEICRKVGYYNVSAAWLTYLYTIHNIFISFLPEASRDKIVYSEGLMADVLAPIGTAIEEGDGYMINGKWNFASGVLHSEWVGLGVLVDISGTGKKEWCAAIMETKKAKVENNWDTFGLRGTGSNAVTAENVFVPKDMLLPLDNAFRTRRPLTHDYDADYQFYGLPFNSTFSIGFSLAALGGAERIIEEFKKIMTKRHRLSFNSTGNETPQAQRVLAEMMVNFHAADALMDKYISLCESFEENGANRPGAEFFAIRSKIVKLCGEIAIAAFTNLGGAVLAVNNPIQRFIKDVLSVSTHKHSLYEDAIQAYGMELFGITANVKP